MPRTPNDLMRDFDLEAGPNARGILWEIIEDVQHSYKLAMSNAGVYGGMVDEVEHTVEDYLANNYGDD